MKITKQQLKKIVREELQILTEEYGKTREEWDAFAAGYPKLVDELANDFTKAASILTSSIKKFKRQKYYDWDGRMGVLHMNGRKAAYKIYQQMYDKHDSFLKSNRISPFDLTDGGRMDHPRYNVQNAYTLWDKPLFSTLQTTKYSNKHEKPSDPALQEAILREDKRDAKLFGLWDIITIYDAFHPEFSKNIVWGAGAGIPGVKQVWEAGTSAPIVSNRPKKKKWNAGGAKKQEALAIAKIQKFCDDTNSKTKKQVARDMAKIAKGIEAYDRAEQGRNA